MGITLKTQHVSTEPGKAMALGVRFATEAKEPVHEAGAFVFKLLRTCGRLDIQVAPGVTERDCCWVSRPM